MQYIIDDLEAFTQSARRLVFNSFNNSSQVKEDEDMMDLLNNISETDQKEMDEILTQNECAIIVKNLAKQQKHKHLDKVRFIINEKIFSQIIEAINARLVSNLLHSLVQKGMIESAYDSEIDDFVFWTKDENPETD